MLVLSRKQSQQIVIGPDIRITVVKLDRNQVRLGIEAPRGMTILREELIARAEHGMRAPTGSGSACPAKSVGVKRRGPAAGFATDRARL